MYVLIEMLKMKNMYERISHVELTFVFIFVRTKIYGQIVHHCTIQPIFSPFSTREVSSTREMFT